MDLSENRIILTNGTDRDYLTQFDEVSNPRQIVEINGASTLEFQLERNDPKWRYFEKPGTTAECNGRVYCIIGDGPISRQRDMSGTHLPVVMKEIWYKLDKKYITAYNIDIAKSEKFDHIDQHMVVLWGNSSDPLYINGTRVNSAYTVGTAQYFFDCLLYGSGWTLDTRYANYWPDGKYDLNTDKKSVLENINLLQTLFGGMLFWDSVGKRVALVDEDKYQVYEGFEIRCRKNLVSIERKEDHDIITRLYPYGNSHLNIAAVNGNREYVDNFTYTTEVLEGILTHNDIYNQEYLLAWGKRKLKTLSRPSYSYDVDFIRYTEEVGAAIPQPEFGKLAKVFDEDIVGDPVMQRITKIDQHVFIDYDCNVSVGDIANTFEGTLKDIQGGAKKADDTISGGGKVPGVDIEGNIPQVDKSNDHWSNVTGDLYRRVEDTEGNVSELWQTAREIGARVSNNEGDIAQLTITATEIRTEVSNLEKGVYSTISQTATQIRTEVRDVERGLQSSITQTAGEIRSEVRSVETGLRSSITQNSNRIALVVDGSGIRAAQIVASINGTTSSVKISADKVDISGVVTFTDLRSNSRTVINGSYITTGTIDASKVNVNKINADNITTGTMSADRIDFTRMSGKRIELGTLVANTVTGTNRVYARSLYFGSNDRIVSAELFRDVTTSKRFLCINPN